MRRVLQVVLGVVIFAYAVNFLGSARTGPDPREIDPDEITPPGTELRIGEEAFVPYRDTRRGRDRDGHPRHHGELHRGRRPGPVDPIIWWE
ncbi:MAG: hypothetical protein GEU81_06780 [Nitriliruptorales bacterium]|nr:hypothetical protein [Nitriliruptorales bacterium]